jgi:hypothetical protein
MRPLRWLRAQMSHASLTLRTSQMARELCSSLTPLLPAPAPLLLLLLLLLPLLFCCGAHVVGLWGSCARYGYE